LTISEPGDALAFNLLSHAYSLDKQLEAAETASRRAISLEPHEPSFWFHLGRILFHKREINEAQTAFEKCISLSQELEWEYYLDSAKLALAQCLSLGQRQSEAKKLALEVNPCTGIWLGTYINPALILQ